MFMKKPDSLIFDMDGTLWDATHTYVASWNEGFRRLNLDLKITYGDLAAIMGFSRRNALAKLLPQFDIENQDKIYDTINEARQELVATLGGELYEGVREGIEILASKYKLFIVSNCPTGMIQQFMDWSGLGKFITDEMAHGINLMPKNHNIKLLIDKHQLVNPYYIGDTDIDSKESELDGIPFVFVPYGFGTTEKYDLKFNNFQELTNYFMQL